MSAQDARGPEEHERASRPVGVDGPRRQLSARMRSLRSHSREPSMARLSRIGIDTSKSVFQLHGVDEKEQVVLRKPPQYVKRYVGHNKNDKIDAEAVCEAMSRPKVQERFVPIKSVEQSAAQMLLGVRESLVKRRTQLTNTIRGHAAEFGLVAAKGLDKIQPLLARIAADDSLPTLTKEMFAVLGREYAELEPRIAQIDKKMLAFHRSNEVTRRLMEVPTIGPTGACLFAPKIVDP